MGKEDISDPMNIGKSFNFSRTERNIPFWT